MKVWVYVSEKHDPEVHKTFATALDSIITDSHWPLDELLAEGYAEGSEDSGWFNVEDTGYLTEVDFHD